MFKKINTQDSLLKPFRKQLQTFHIKLEKGNELELVLMQMVDDFNRENPGFELNMKVSIYKIFSWLIQNDYMIMLHSNSNPKRLFPVRLKEVLDYVENNYQNEISVHDVAKMACMSYYHFSRFFKKATGKTFVEYLNYIRLYEAEKLILFTDQSIADIAQKVGFKNVSYFDQLFKDKNGLSPREYKRQYAKKEQDN